MKKRPPSAPRVLSNSAWAAITTAIVVFGQPIAEAIGDILRALAGG